MGKDRPQRGESAVGEGRFTDETVEGTRSADDHLNCRETIRTDDGKFHSLHKDSLRRP